MAEFDRKKSPLQERAESNPLRSWRRRIHYAALPHKLLLFIRHIRYQSGECHPASLSCASVSGLTAAAIRPCSYFLVFFACAQRMWRRIYLSNLSSSHWLILRVAASLSNAMRRPRTPISVLTYVRLSRSESVSVPVWQSGYVYPNGESMSGVCRVVMGCFSHTHPGQVGRTAFTCPFGRFINDKQHPAR